jgi:hypothetical protein
VKYEVVGLIFGKRSYDCEVVGVEGRFKLSSKSLAQADRSGSRAEAPNDETSSCVDGKSSYGDKSEPSECISSSDDDPVDKATLASSTSQRRTGRRCSNSTANAHVFIQTSNKSQKGVLKLMCRLIRLLCSLHSSRSSPWSIGSRFGCSTPSDTIAGVSTP